jgi:hypothetical protein
MLGLESSLARDARLFDIVSKTRAAEIRFAVNDHNYPTYGGPTCTSKM